MIKKVNQKRQEVDSKIANCKIEFIASIMKHDLSELQVEYLLTEMLIKRTSRRMSKKHGKTIV